jgi:hypothetical protein
MKCISGSEGMRLDEIISCNRSDDKPAAVCRSVLLWLAPNFEASESSLNDIGIRVPISVLRLCDEDEEQAHWHYVDEDRIRRYIVPVR